MGRDSHQLQCNAPQQMADVAGRIDGLRDDWAASANAAQREEVQPLKLPIESVNWSLVEAG